MEGAALELAAIRMAKSRSAGFEQILVQNQRRVYLTALRMVGNQAEAQDAAQEVFFRLHKHLDRLNPEIEVAAWLYRVTVNVCHDLMRQRRPSTPIEEAEPPVSPGAHEAVERDQQRRLVALALARLPEKERAAVVLRDIEGLPAAEVARILGSSEATVRSQASKARVKIRQILKRYL